MKNSICIMLILSIIIACSSTKTNVVNAGKSTAAASNDTVKIANEEIEYEVIIIEPGFNFWLQSTAFPRGYYTQRYMETKNYNYILEWNNRARQPQTYAPELYEMTINYEPTIDYGYEVNYMIYNYMIYFQNKYNQKLYGYVPSR